MAAEPVLILRKKSPSSSCTTAATKWAVFLLSLRDWIERSEGRPHPYDVKIHPGD